MATTSQIFISSGAWVCPDSVISVSVECWGGGGGGGVGNVSWGGGGGGGGGAYAKKNYLSVTPGVSYSIAAASVSYEVDGQASAFESDCIAAGGKGASHRTKGLGGLATDSVGDIKYNGGDGRNGYLHIEGGVGGGGGGGAGSGGDGTNALVFRGGAGTAVSGGNGGDNNQNGNVYGGGGGGGDEGKNGGNGATGQVKITWTVPINIVKGVIST